jgi:hypothetical protein
MKTRIWSLIRKLLRKGKAEGLRDLGAGDRVWYGKLLGTVTEIRVQQGIRYQLVSAQLDNGLQLVGLPREQFTINIPTFKHAPVDWGYLNRGN